MEKCPCEKCVLLAICKPKILAINDDPDDPDEEYRPKTDDSLVTSFVFDTIQFNRPVHCSLLEKFLGIKEEPEDNGTTGYSVKTEKIIAIGEAFGFDMSPLVEKL